MPEGPSLLIVKENISPFIGKKIIAADGNAKQVAFNKLTGKKILDIRTWGKQLFIVVKDVTVRIHFLMFGSYSVDEQTRPDRSVRLHLTFKKGEIFFYTCAVKELEGDLDTLYDWEADVLSDYWNPARPGRTDPVAGPDGRQQGRSRHLQDRQEPLADRLALQPLRLQRLFRHLR